MSKSQKLDEIIKHYLGEVITSEIDVPNFLITISEVRCSTDLSTAKIFVSILPENFAGTALKRLRSKSGHLANILKKKANLVRVPRIVFLLDASFKVVEKINKTFDEIENENMDEV